MRKLFLLFTFIPSLVFGGGSRHCDGNDAVQFGHTNVMDITGDMTLMAWIYVNTWASAPVIDKLNDSVFSGYFFGLKHSGTAGNDLAYFELSTGWVHNTNAALPSNEWIHVAVVGKGTTGTFYVNGEEDGTFTYNIPASNTQPLRFCQDYSAEFLTGDEAHPMIFNRALSKSEIQSSMRNPNSIVDSRIFYAPLNEIGASPTFYDYSIYRATGTNTASASSESFNGPPVRLLRGPM